MKPYYQDEHCTIYHGDCREVLPALEGVDLILTDPPWGVSHQTDSESRGRGVRSRSSSEHERKNWRANDFPPVIGDDEEFSPEHLLDFDNVVLWGGNHFASRLPDGHFWLAWDRKDRRAADSAVTDCELAWTQGTEYRTVRMFRHMWAGYQRDSRVGKRHLHPTEKPPALMSWCLSWFPGAGHVCDPYMGSGPTLEACKHSGVQCVGIEVSEEYCEVAANRLRQKVLF